MRLNFLTDIGKSGKSCEEYIGTKKYVDTGNVQYDTIVGYETYSFDEKPSRANVIVDIGDVLFAKMQNSIKVICIDDTNKDYIFSTGFYCLKDERILPEYLKYYFLSEEFNIKKDKLCKGATMKSINDDGLKQIDIDVPSIEEQKKTIEILNSLFSAIKEKNKQIELYNELDKSRFIELFGLPVSNSKKWNTEKMREVAPAVNYSGGFEDAVWLLNLDMVEAQTGRILDYLYVNEEEVGNSTCTFDTTNVLYSKLRPYLNKVVIPDRCGYATSELIPLKPNPMKLERTYLAFMLRSDEFVNMINEKVAGAKMPRVSMSDFREFDVPVPPMELQKQFDAFVEQTDKSKLATTETLKYLEELKASLMSKYFE